MRALGCRLENFIARYVAEVIDLKKASDLFDSLYAVPKSSRQKNKEIKALPIKGYNELLKNLIARINAKIHFSSQANISGDKPNYQLFTNKGLTDPELIIWTGNPLKLIEYKDTSCGK